MPDGDPIEDVLAAFEDGLPRVERGLSTAFGQFRAARMVFAPSAGGDGSQDLAGRAAGAADTLSAFVAALPSDSPARRAAASLIDAARKSDASGGRDARPPAEPGRALRQDVQRRCSVTLSRLGAAFQVRDALAQRMAHLNSASDLIRSTPDPVRATLLQILFAQAGALAQTIGAACDDISSSGRALAAAVRDASAPGGGAADLPASLVLADEIDTLVPLLIQQDDVHAEPASLRGAVLALLWRVRQADAAATISDADVWFLAEFELVAASLRGAVIEPGAVAAGLGNTVDRASVGLGAPGAGPMLDHPLVAELKGLYTVDVEHQVHERTLAQLRRGA